MQKRGRLLDTKIKKFETLKLNYVRHLSAPANRDTQVDDDLHDSSFVNFGSKHEVCMSVKSGSKNQICKCLLICKSFV